MTWVCSLNGLRFHHRSIKTSEPRRHTINNVRMYACIAKLPFTSLLSSKLFSFNFVIHCNVPYVRRCFQSHASNVYSTVVRLPNDDWPWKSSQQCPLTWWIFVWSLIQISALYVNRTRHEENVSTGNGLRDNQRTDNPKTLCSLLTIVSGGIQIQGRLRAGHHHCRARKT